MAFLINSLLVGCFPNIIPPVRLWFRKKSKLPVGLQKIQPPELQNYYSNIFRCGLGIDIKGFG